MKRHCNMKIQFCTSGLCRSSPWGQTLTSTKKGNDVKSTW